MRSDDSMTCTSYARDAALVEAVSGGWWYSVGLPSDQTLAVFFTDGDLLPRRKAGMAQFLMEQLRMTTVTRNRCCVLEERVQQQRWRIFDARSSLRRVPIADGWVAAGDALMALDPLCGQGVTAAISSGIEVAAWLLGRPGWRDHNVPDWIDQVAARFNTYMQQRAHIYSLETRWQEALFWQRRSHGST
jgi:2-polyprenyl-6-methoxyphenol hydroxylase-like FAD-dependent oxidoreductase